MTAWSSEAAVRVGFVFNFIKIIEWPNANANPEFHLCVLGADEETKEVVSTIEGKELNRAIGDQFQKQKITITYFADNAYLNLHLGECQMIYKRKRMPNLILPHPLPSGAVLVVDEPTSKEQDISIAMKQGDDGRIEFTIDQTAVTRAGVNISSQLLKLAKITRGGPIEK